jgi:DNA invertase Pin-like site-specific DNA recombinase
MRNRYGYARVSSKDQNSLRQLDALRGLGIPEKNIYTDYQSGKDFERAQYQKLKSNLSQHDLLVIKSIDRLGRNYDEIIQEWKVITKEIKAYVKVIDIPLLDTTAERRDLTATFIADMFLQILSYVAEQERVNIRQRQAEGIALAKAMGVRFGRPKLVRPENFSEIYTEYKRGKFTLQETLDILGLKRSSFFNLAKSAQH